VVLIATVQIKKVTNAIRLNFTTHARLPCQFKPLKISPPNNAINAVANPNHGVQLFALPVPMKYPKKSPTMQDAKPNSGPINIPVSTDMKIVKENCVTPKEKEKYAFSTTFNAVITPR